jgi:ACS family hexuronate transporter-like MFS transporter
MVAGMVTRRTAWLVAIVATLTMTVSYADRLTLAVLAPKVTEALGISNEAYGWLGSAFAVAYLVGTPVSGWWIDRAGPRRGLLVSVLAWSIVAALHALVPGFAVLFALRLALGLTEGPGFPGAAQTVQRILPPADRERGFGVLFTGSSIGAMIAPALATLIFRHAGWRAAFLGTAAAGLLWLPLWYAVTRSPAVRAQLAVATEPSEPRPAFRVLATHPIVVRALIGVLAAAPMFSFPQTWGAKFLVKTYAIRQADVDRYLWLPPLVLDACAIGFGHLASRQRRPAGASPRGLFAIAAALTSSLVLLPLAGTAWSSIAVIAIAAAGGGAMYALITSDLLARMPTGSLSLASGVLAGGQSLALIIVNPMIGRAVDKLGDYAVISVVLGLWAVPGSLIWLAWRPPARFGDART